MTPLFRYWLIPGRLRRLHIAARIAIAFVIILLTAVLSEVILKQKAAAFQNPSLVMIPALILFVGLPALLSVVGAFAGATLIAGERQKETWETLLLCGMPAWQVVLLKVSARMVFCLALALPAMVWWTSLAYKVTQLNGADMHAQSHAVAKCRIVVFLAWSFLQVIGHLAPFVAFGIAVSSRCRRVNEALLTCAASFTVYGVLLWQLYASLRYHKIFDSATPGLLPQLFRWPVLAFLSGDYNTPRDVLMTGWQTNLAVDLIWIVAAPLLLLIPTIAWSRLSRKSPRRARIAAAA